MASIQIFFQETNFQIWYYMVTKNQCIHLYTSVMCCYNMYLLAVVDLHCSRDVANKLLHDTCILGGSLEQGAHARARTHTHTHTHTHK